MRSRATSLSGRNMPRLRKKRSSSDKAKRKPAVPSRGWRGAIRTAGFPFRNACSGDSSYTAGRMATARAAMSLEAAEPDARAQELLRIDRLTVDPRLVVQMRAGGAGGEADLADGLRDVDRLAAPPADFRQMAVTGGQAMAVVDLDHIAVAALPAGDGHAAVGGGAHRIAALAAQIH